MLSRTLVPILCAVAASALAERVTLTGNLTDNSGKPLNDATVFVYRAGVKKGYSTYCPTCYIDCGKYAVTDQSGRYVIQRLNIDLWFDLVVIRDGYAPTFVRKVDPVRGPVKATLERRPPITDASHLVRGRVIGPHGRALRHAVIEPVGISAIREGGRPFSTYGLIPGLDPLAVTNKGGEFELAHKDAATGMLLRVQARGMAPKLVALSTGSDRKTIAVSDGAVVRGRLVDAQGRPVPDAEIGLIGTPRGGFGGNLTVFGNPHHEFRIGTQKDGSFVITNVPAPASWYIYAKMESIAARGATAPVECATTRDNEEVNVGDVRMGPGFRLRGKVTLPDHSNIADGMRVIISSDRAWDSQTALLGRDGKFEFVGLSAGKYEINPAVRGYSLKEESAKINVDRDLDDVELVLHANKRR